MPLFSFFQIEDRRRTKLADLEAPDDQAAREFGIGLAEQILRAHSRDDQPSSSHIVILDDAGIDCASIISERC